jgi:hypothetical protein
MLNKNSLIFFFLSLSFITLPIKAEDLSLTVTGVGDTKANAIIDAQRNALRTSYGEFVSTNITTLNNQLAKNENVNLVSGTIKEFKLLSESVNDFSIPPITEVLMQITVNKGKLVSFAKAIGDNVEIQGSLFGAELRQQEINKKNEVTAMEHLVKKARIMSTFFDYEIKVDSPKLGVEDGGHSICEKDMWRMDEYKKKEYLSKCTNPFGFEDAFFIHSSLVLNTNQNYINLMSAVKDSISQISMPSDEIKKYNELGIPFYRINIVNANNPSCLGELTIIPWKSSANQVQKLTSTNISKSCSTKEFFLRSQESYKSILQVRAQIFKSLLSYEVSRKTKSGKTLLLPFHFTTDVNDNNNFGYGSVILGSGNPSELFIEMIKRNQPDNDKLNIVKNCGKYGEWDYLTFCYANGDFSSYAMTIARTYSKWTEISVGTKKKNSFRDKLPPRALSDDMYSFLKRNRDAGFNSLPEIYGYNAKSSYSSSVEILRGQNFIMLPKNYEFAMLIFEDIVEKDEISSITAYLVNPDNPTK